MLNSRNRGAYMESQSSEIATKVIVSLVESFVKTVIKKSSNYLKDLTHEMEIDFGQAYIDYLQIEYQKQSKIKTLLYRHEPKDLYAFYVCTSLRLERSVIDPTCVKNLLKVGKRLVVTGTGGIGKSILFKHLFLNSITTTNYIPVLIELRGLNSTECKELDFLDFIYQCLCNKGFRLEKKYFEYSLQSGKYVFLFDGYDEIRNTLTERATQALLDFCNKYNDNYFIISSRPQNCFIGWEDFKECRCLPLEKDQALCLIDKLDYHAESKKKFYEDLREDLYDKYESFASNPLLLTIMLITYVDRVSFPDNLNDFYEQAFIALFHTHDSSKGAYQRDIACGLGYEDFKRIFSYFCFKSFFRSDYEFSESNLIKYIDNAKEKIRGINEFDSLLYLTDLQKSVCMLCQEGLRFRFIHRSFQEYFAALYLTQLSDENQTKLITSWIKDGQYSTSSLLTMLLDLQPERFSKNILIPLLDDYYEAYKSNEFDSYRMLKEVYSGITHVEDEEGDEVIALTLNSEYLRGIISLSCSYGNFKATCVDEEVRRKNMKELTEKLDLEFGEPTSDRHFKFEEMKNMGCENEVKKCVWWAIEMIEYTLNLRDKLKLREPILKRRFDFILEEL